MGENEKYRLLKEVIERNIEAFDKSLELLNESLRSLGKSMSKLSNVLADVNISNNIEMKSLKRVTKDDFNNAVKYYFEIPKSKCEAFKTLIIQGFTPKESYELLKATFKF